MLFLFQLLVAVSVAVFVSVAVLKQFLNAGVAYFKEVFECSRSASGLMQFLNAIKPQKNRKKSQLADND